MYRDRRYEAAEVRAILARAARQKNASTDAPPRTLEEIEALGEELGLSREAVRAAVSGGIEPAPIAPRTLGEWIRGGPAMLRRDVVVPGRIDASKHEALVDHLRVRLGAAGRAEVLGETLTWTFGGQGARFVTVTMKPAEGGTRIRIEETLSPLAGGLYGGLVGGLGGGLGGGLSPLLPLVLGWPGWTIPVFVFGCLALVFAVARAIFASAARKRAASVDEIVAALSAELASAPARIAVPARIASEPVVEDDAEPEASARISRGGP